MAQNDKQITDWHSAFAGGFSLSMRSYKNDIEIQRNVPLTKLPPEMDALVIKKKHDVYIDNAIGRLFRTYSIIEYKNPNDALNIDVVYKAIAYAGYFKATGETVNAIPVSELSITILRSAKPQKLFSDWLRERKKITNPYPGIYYIDGVIEVPMQIVVTRELDDPELVPLKILMENPDEESVRAFLKQEYTEQGDRENADAVLQVSVSVNKELYERIRSDEAMCQALRELMKDDFDRTEKVTEQQTKVLDIKNVMESFGVSLEKAMESLKIPSDQRSMYAGLVNKK